MFWKLCQWKLVTVILKVKSFLDHGVIQNIIFCVLEKKYTQVTEVKQTNMKFENRWENLEETARKDTTTSP